MSGQLRIYSVFVLVTYLVVLSYILKIIVFIFPFLPYLSLCFLVYFIFLSIYNSFSSSLWRNGRFLVERNAGLMHSIDYSCSELRH